MPFRLKFSQNGSIVISMMAMLILISLGVGIIMMFSTSSLQKSEHNIKLRAANLAQAGFRYAAGEYISAGDLSAKFDRLASLHGENVTLLNNDGSFQLQVFPYWFVTTANVNNSTVLPLNLLGKFPTDFQAALPASGTVKINNDFYDYTNGSATPGAGFNPDQFSITLDKSVTLPRNTSVQLTFSPQPASSQTIDLNGTITLSDPNDEWLDLFPQRNGLIEIFKDQTQSLGTYKYKERIQNSLHLTGITPVEDNQLPLTINSASFITVKKQALVLSTGNLGTGNLSADLDLGLNVYLTDEVQIPADAPEPLDMGGDGPSKPEVFDDEQDDHTQLNNWEFDANDSIPESDKKTITTHEVQTEFGVDWDSRNYVTFQNFTEIEQDKGYTAQLIDKERLPETARSKNLNGLWGNASDNIYFVGDDGTILLWDGTAFTSMTSNTTEDLNAIWGLPKEKTDPADTDNIFVGGDNGETLINEASAGWAHASQGQNYDIYAAFGISWGHFDGYGQAGTNPYNWDSPNTADVLANYNWYINEFGGNANFRCLWAVEEAYSDNATYGASGPQPRQNIMVGEFSGGDNAGDGIIMHEFYEPAVIITGTPLRGVWGSALDNIYAVGDAGSVYRNTSGDSYNYSYRWRNWTWWRPAWEDSWQGQWIKIPAGDIPTSENLNGVYGNSADDFYIIGDNGTILYNKGAGFELVPTAEVTTEDLNSIWGSDRTGIYAVGDNGTIVFLGYPANKIGGHVLPLAKNAELAAKWAGTNKFLNYTIQVKTVWGDQLKYAASGICFRWHQPEPDKYAGYGISYMQYDPSDNELNGILINDMIPDDIKPEFHGTQEKNDRLLIVLWEQYIQGGAQQRRWLAYKDITDDSNVKKASNGTPRDLSSLFVRVREKRIDNVKLNDIEIYYGNASISGQTPDNIYNNTIRNEYNPTFGTGANTIKWPVFDIQNWKDCLDPLTVSCDDADAFTLVDNVSVEAAPIKADTTTNYWIINPNAELTILKNSYTIRTSRFTTPDGDAFGTQSDRSEIGLHVFGDIGDYGTQELVSFTDFAVQLGVDSNAVNVQSGFGSLE